MARESRGGREPQVSLARSTPARMWLAALCAGLGILQSAFSDSFASLALALTAVFFAVTAEYLAGRFLRTSVSLRDGSAVASALILTLLLPGHLSPLIAGFGAAFAMIVVKHSFGGLGANWLNPALGGWLFVRLSWPDAFARALEPQATDRLPEFLDVLGRFFRDFLNSRLFVLFGAELPPDFPGYFLHSGPGIVADRGVLALLAGTVLISAARISRAWVPALFLGTCALLVRLAGALSPAVPWGGDVLSGLCSGGTVAAAFLLLADPATGAKSAAGAALAAVAAALLSFLFRYRGGEPLGAVFAAALMNVLFPLIRLGESRLFYAAGGQREPERKD